MLQRLAGHLHILLLQVCASQVEVLEVMVCDESRPEVMETGRYLGALQSVGAEKDPSQPCPRAPLPFPTERITNRFLAQVICKQQILEHLGFQYLRDGDRSTCQLPPE